ncbi:ABC transporter [Babesia caballi]|uniref:ABC transporter n=1 Tax=Babesia caballi TaxID=5871 RepID=A0AAV4LLR7_BABCB|nr:ABC transporter [Babesia caballi]
MDLHGLARRRRGAAGKRRVALRLRDDVALPRDGRALGDGEVAHDGATGVAALVVRARGRHLLLLRLALAPPARPVHDRLTAHQTVAAVEAPLREPQGDDGGLPGDAQGREELFKGHAQVLDTVNTQQNNPRLEVSHLELAVVGLVERLAVVDGNDLVDDAVDEQQRRRGPHLAQRLLRVPEVAHQPGADGEVVLDDAVDGDVRRLEHHAADLDAPLLELRRHRGRRTRPDRPAEEHDGARVHAEREEEVDGGPHPTVDQVPVRHRHLRRDTVARVLHRHDGHVELVRHEPQLRLHLSDVARVACGVCRGKARAYRAYRYRWCSRARARAVCRVALPRGDVERRSELVAAGGAQGREGGYLVALDELEAGVAAQDLLEHVFDAAARHRALTLVEHVAQALLGVEDGHGGKRGRTAQQLGEVRLGRQVHPHPLADKLALVPRAQLDEHLAVGGGQLAVGQVDDAEAVGLVEAYVHVRFEGELRQRVVLPRLGLAGLGGALVVPAAEQERFGVHVEPLEHARVVEGALEVVHLAVRLHHDQELLVHGHAERLVHVVRAGLVAEEDRLGHGLELAHELGQLPRLDHLDQGGHVLHQLALDRRAGQGAGVVVGGHGQLGVHAEDRGGIAGSELCLADAPERAHAAVDGHDADDALELAAHDVDFLVDDALDVAVGGRVEEGGR